MTCLLKRIGYGQKICKTHNNDQAIIWKCMYCCSEATYLCNMGTLHLCKNCKKKSEYHRKFNTQCRGGAECPLGVPHPRAGSMTPFPLGCGLCKSDQANLLNNNIEVYSSSRMNNLLN